MREVGAARRASNPGGGGRSHQSLGIRDAQKPRGLRGPVDAIDNDRAVGSKLVRKVANVSLRELVELILIVSASCFPLKLVGAPDLAGIQLVRVSLLSNLAKLAINVIYFFHLGEHAWGDILMWEFLEDFLSALGHIARPGG